jgi:hypothetical protein
VIAWFAAHRAAFPSDAVVPENEQAFYAMEDTILTMAEHDWLGDAPPPWEPPA